MIIIGILGIFVEIILILLLALFVILLLILLIPFDYTISALLKEKAFFNLLVHWGFFQVELLLEDKQPIMKARIFQRIIMNEPVKKRSRKKPRQKPGKSNSRRPGIAFLKEILKFSKEVLNVLKPKEITAFGSYGLNDPVNTALVSFIINLFSDLVPQAKIGLTPLFDSEMTDVEINISGRIRLIALVYILIKYIFKKEVRKIVFQKRIRFRFRLKLWCKDNTDCCACHSKQ